VERFHEISVSIGHWHGPSLERTEVWNDTVEDGSLVVKWLSRLSDSLLSGAKGTLFV